MTRLQAITIGLLAGLVGLVCLAMIMLLFVDLSGPTLLSAPSPTLSLEPISLPTPTFPNFMPTAGLETPVVEPTPTNTRVPTVTPRPPQEPTPTVVFLLPTRRPTDTPIPTPLPPPPPPTNTPVLPTPTPPPREYSISFWAEEPNLVQGECTDLEWDVIGATAVMLDGRSVDPSGDREVCPDEDASYQLTVQLPDNAQLEQRIVEISVEEKEEEEEQPEEEEEEEQPEDDDDE